MQHVTHYSLTAATAATTTITTTNTTRFLTCSKSHITVSPNSVC